MSDYWEGHLPPNKAQKPSDNPFAPDHPRWNEWNRDFLHHFPHTPTGKQKTLESYQRMAAVKRSVEQAKTDRQKQYDSIMVEVESYRRWQEAEKTKETWKALKELGSKLLQSVGDVVQVYADITHDLFQVITNGFQGAQKIKMGRGFIFDCNFAPLPDVWDLIWDIRLCIASYTWLQYDAI